MLTTSINTYLVRDSKQIVPETWEQDSGSEVRITAAVVLLYFVFNLIGRSIRIRTSEGRIPSTYTAMYTWEYNLVYSTYQLPWYQPVYRMITVMRTNAPMDRVGRNWTEPGEKAP